MCVEVYYTFCANVKTWFCCFFHLARLLANLLRRKKNGSSFPLDSSPVRFCKNRRKQNQYLRLYLSA